MRLRLAALVSLLPLGLAADSTVPVSRAVPVDRWEADMCWFDKLDHDRPAKPGGVVFVGSSSIRMWDLARSFPGCKPLNRGFGGSHLADSVRHVDRLVLRHRPRTVVLYAGDNDIAAGKTPDEVVKDFEAFVAAVREELPETKIVYVGIKPSLARWELAEPMRAANAGVKAVCERTERCEFVDVWPAMLGDDGKPRKELFVFDGLHMSPAGYAIWNDLVGPHVE
ncbi:MAG TPA: SGNH/GDSL hydrolase family protein [Planctomycetaceae bacterium]